MATLPVSEETENTGSIPVPEKSADYSPTADLSFSDEEGVPGSSYRTITITRGDGGYGGPLTITPTEERHTVLYMTGGGMEPEPLAKILALSGMKAVNGNLETCPDEEVALAIIDCGGTLRCGIYPSKGIPTANLLATGKSGPLAKYMTKDLYVSAVTSAQIACPEHPAQAGTAAAPSRETVSADLTRDDSCHSLTDEKAIAEALPNEPNEPNVPAMQPGSQQEHAAVAEKNPFSIHRGQKWLIPVAAISKVVSIFHQSARDAVKTCLEIILPFMGFAALFIGICRGSGLTEFIAGLIKPMGGSLPGLFITGIICSIPGLSAILGAGAVAAQMFATVIGDLIQSGGIAPAAALPALFAINCQCACDFIPVGLGMLEAKPETMQLGIPAVTLSRFATGWIRILIAVIFSIGLYA
ncbi:MAG: PTS glucitol/sorbitol transporter subunit IIB [Lachnospiraceae bacterium]|nr:PTS glucitol/sorbitol transporter subunit IIB [Lachnospiraceae bacterium]